MNKIPPKLKLKLFGRWAKNVKKIFESDDRLEVKVKEDSHEVEIKIKVKK